MYLEHQLILLSKDSDRAKHELEQLQIEIGPLHVLCNTTESVHHDNRELPGLSKLVHCTHMHMYIVNVHVLIHVGMDLLPTFETWVSTFECTVYNHGMPDQEDHSHLDTGDHTHLPSSPSD